MKTRAGDGSSHMAPDGPRWPVWLERGRGAWAGDRLEWESVTDTTGGSAGAGETSGPF